MVEFKRSRIMDAQQNQVSQDQDTLKEIPKWTRKYAQNRTLTIMVLMAMTMLFGGFFAALISFPLGLASAGFRKGNMVLGYVGIAVSVAVFVAMLIFLVITIKKFAGKNRGTLDQLIDKWTYGKEGTVAVSKPKSSKKKICLEIIMSVTWFILFYGSWMLAAHGYISYKYLQPVSALYFVPLMVCGWYFFQSPRMGPIYLLHPMLFAIHAILIVAGIPMFFADEAFCIVSVCLPYIGYGFLTYAIGHIYSRYALKKLKTAVNLQETNNG
jgi:hypothetical protein